MKRQPAKGVVEGVVGFAGRFYVTYRRNGRRFWDAIYAPTAEEAERDFLGLCRELGWAVSEVVVEERVPSGPNEAAAREP